MKAPVLAAALLLAANAHAQTPKPKLPAPPKPPAVGVKGAAQLAGGVLRFGELFALKSGFTYQIVAARYSLDPFDDYNHVTVGPDEKLLVLQVAIKNNRRDADRFFDAGAHTVQAVTADNQTIEGAAYRLKSKPGEGFAPTLKPGQGLGQGAADPVELAISLPINARVVKLVLKQGRDGTSEEVLRFFVAGATEAEAGGKPDPANAIAPLPDWAAPGKTVPAGVFYPSHSFFFRVDGFSSAEKIGDSEPEDGKRWVFVKATVKNGHASKNNLFEFYQGDSIADLYLVNADGEKHRASRILKASRDETADGELDGGEERAVRIGFQVPKDAKFKTVLLGSPRGHKYVFDAADAGK